MEDQKLPTDMGLTEEALDILRKAEAKVSSVAGVLKETGVYAGKHLSDLVSQLWAKLKGA